MLCLYTSTKHGIIYIIATCMLFYCLTCIILEKDTKNQNSISVVKSIKRLFILRKYKETLVEIKIE